MTEYHVLYSIIRRATVWPKPPVLGIDKDEVLPLATELHALEYIYPRGSVEEIAELIRTGKAKLYDIPVMVR